MFERSAREPGSPPNARLIWLAKQLSREPAPGGQAGRLVRRWVPVAVTGDGVPVKRRWFGVVLVVAVVAGAVFGAVALLGGRPVAEGPPSLPVARPVATGLAPPSPAELVISVVGKVRSPGLVTLPPGSRVADAVRAAGGAAPGTDLTGLNLARKLADGEQVAVGAPAPVAGAAAVGAPPGRIDLNTATPEQLDSLPGVGEVMARRIVEWRAAHGGFAKVEQLRDVEGIGETKFSKLRDQVSVG
ncbi:ComEA family DNA-binding protein [Amycolatopsis sp. H20-H5]|uniref:ComEA family DNA-binding protein n=1 Tax=Amycolatopsis sp. H20-H5 TaxID=3046309 RepID=UPI002DB8527C|nr:ComEA family DNA-binding protein [Amycolatopsis sp. H20-H5]MEC3977275.1 ComEA family DNA-binding protein [Amycolatopsis sp. H20-H5]